MKRKQIWPIGPLGNRLIANHGGFRLRTPAGSRWIWADHLRVIWPAGAIIAMPRQTAGMQPTATGVGHINNLKFYQSGSHLIVEDVSTETAKPKEATT